MSYFANLKQKAKKDPKIVVLPELDFEKNSIIKEAIELVKEEGTAIPFGLTTEFIEESGKLDEFADAYPTRNKLSLKVRKRIVKKPVAFAAMMVKQGYAHGMVAGRYETSATVMTYINAIIGEEVGKIRSAIFFREPPEEYPVFNLIACADMVVNPDPDEEELYRIIVTSAETFEALTGKEPTIALLSYITGLPSSPQAQDQNIKKIIITQRI